MLLISSSRRASRSVVRALHGAGFEASPLGQRGLFHPIAVKVGLGEEPEALRVARAADPSVQNR